MQLFKFAASEREIKHIGTVNHVHTDGIRELATQDGQAGLVASGGERKCEQTIILPVLSVTNTSLRILAGFDGTLCVSAFIDAQRVTVTNKALLAGKVIGSVKWPSFNSSQTAAHRKILSLS